MTLAPRPNRPAGGQSATDSLARRTRRQYPVPVRHSLCPRPRNGRRREWAWPGPGAAPLMRARGSSRRGGRAARHGGIVPRIRSRQGERERGPTARSAASPTLRARGGRPRAPPTAAATESRVPASWCPVSRGRGACLSHTPHLPPPFFSLPSFFFSLPSLPSFSSFSFSSSFSSFSGGVAILLALT